MSLLMFHVLFVYFIHPFEHSNVIALFKLNIIIIIYYYYYILLLLLLLNVCEVCEQLFTILQCEKILQHVVSFGHR